MGFPTDRIILFDRSMNPLSELAPSEVYSRVRKEELNGEHSLVITTSRQLQEGWRALTVDGTGKWREWVVTETPQEHTAGPNAIGTYRFVWSLQYDLTRSYYHDMDEAVSIGLGSSCTASEAAGHVLTGVSWWTVGTCDGADIIPGGYLSADERTNPIASPKSNKTNSRGRVTGDATQTGCVFIRESAWSKLSKLVECTAYEVDAEIVVSSAFVVTERRLCLRAHLGNPVPLRRFDWGHDVTDIKRTPDPGPYYCRVVPLGKTEKEYADDDVTEFDWPMDITEETGTEQNPGPYWIQDDEAAQVFRIKNPDGTYDYPTVAVEYRSEDDPELLLAAAQADLHNHTRPNVTYEANVLQFARAGMDAQGVMLGDEIQIVDYGFNPDAALRLQGRVTSIEIDELSPETGTNLTIGNLTDNTADLLSELGFQFDSLVTMHGDIRESLEKMDTAVYVRTLMDRLNTEIAGTGGYTYLTEGEGLVTYDRAVADPLIGSEATRVVQLKGGYLRIASAKKNPFSGIDDWDFKTILDAGHIVSDLVTTVKIVAGFIGNATSGNYWNLDTGELRMQSTKTMVGNQSLSNYVTGIADTSASTATQALNQQEILSRLTGGYTTEGLYIYNGHLYINGSAINTGYIGNATTDNYWNLDTGEFVLRKALNSNTILETKHGLYTVGVNYLHRLYGGVSSSYTTSKTIPVWSTGIVYNGTQTSLDDDIILAPIHEVFSNSTYMQNVEGDHWSSVAAKKNLHVIAHYQDSTYTALSLHSNNAGIYVSSNAASKYNIDGSSTSVKLDETSITLRVPQPSGSSVTRYIELSQSDGLKTFGVPLVLASSSVTFSSNATITSNNFAAGTINGSYGVRVSRLCVGSDGDTSGYNNYPGDGSVYARNIYLGDGSASGGTTTSGLVQIYGRLGLNGSLYTTLAKSRSVKTEDYDSRLLFCYETPTPMFGDIGSGVIGDDGLCYIEIDDIFAETIYLDGLYQVFLQKCGQGDLWVSDKKSNHFVVAGTPGLKFDWELKARQRDYANVRLDNTTMFNSQGDSVNDGYVAASQTVSTYGNTGEESIGYANEIEALYGDYISEIERAYENDLAA